MGISVAKRLIPKGHLAFVALGDRDGDLDELERLDLGLNVADKVLVERDLEHLGRGHGEKVLDRDGELVPEPVPSMSQILGVRVER